MTLLETPASNHQTITSAVHALYRALAALPDLRPSPTVNGLFGQLVDLVVTAPPSESVAVLADPEVQQLAPRLRELCARGESALEATWSARIAVSDDPVGELERFPYLANYQSLTRMELSVLRAATSRPLRTIAFAGSGPLPLTSLMMQRELRAVVHGLDRDPDAVAAAGAVLSALGAPDVVAVRADVRDADFSGYDAVVLAALVGTTPVEKAEILQQLTRSMRPGALLLVRSAHGLRTLLYPDVNADALPGADILDVVHPDGDVINSAIVARIRGTSVPSPRVGTGE